MDSNVNVLLYSKFSQACRKFIELLDTVPVLKTDVTLICIDNKDARKRVLANQKLNIKEVPCILRIYDSGYIESFEGERSFEILQSYASQMQQMTQMTQMTPLPQQIPQMTPLPQPQLTQTTPLPQMPQMSQQVQQMSPQLVPQKAQPPMQKSVSFSTPIEELGDDEEQSGENVAVNTYIHIPKNKDLLENDTRSISRAIKGEGQKDSAMSKALQMQKERESSEQVNVRSV